MISKKEVSKLPSWAEITGFIGITWLDKNGRISGDPPVKDSICKIKFKKYLSIELPKKFWILFYPDSSDGKYLDPKMRMVECFSKKTVDKKEGIIEIKVNQSIPLSEIIKNTTESFQVNLDLDGLKDPNGRYADKFRYRASKKGDFINIENNFQGDVVISLVCQKSKNGYNAVLYCFSSFDKSFFRTGNKKLNDDELELIRKYCDLNKILL